MNRSYKVIFSGVRQAPVVASEFSRSRGKGSRTARALGALVLGACLAIGPLPGAQAVTATNASVNVTEDSSGNAASSWGVSTEARGKASTAFGTGSEALGDSATAFGISSYADAENSLAALGATVAPTGANSAAIGKDARVTVADTVALGSLSVADRKGGSADAYLRDGRSGGEWISTDNAIAVGNSSVVTRQITGVAAGSADTDAANVAQLKALAASIPNPTTYQVEREDGSGNQVSTYTLKSSDQSATGDTIIDTDTFVTESGVSSRFDSRANAVIHTVTLTDNAGKERTSFEVTDRDTTLLSSKEALALGPDNQLTLSVTDTAGNAVTGTVDLSGLAGAGTTYTVTREDGSGATVSTYALTSSDGSATGASIADTDTFVAESAVSSSAGTSATGTAAHTVTLTSNAGQALTSFEIPDADTTAKSLAVEGDAEKTVTLTDSAGGTVSATFSDRDTTVKSLAVEGDAEKTITLTDSADNKVTATFSDRDTTYSLSGTKGEKAADGSTAYTIDLVDGSGAGAGSASFVDTDTHNGLRNDSNAVVYTDGTGSVTITDMDGRTTTITGIRDTAGTPEITFAGDTGEIANPEKVTIRGGAGGELTEGNIGVVADKASGTMTVKLAKDLQGLGTVSASAFKAGGTVLNEKGLAVGNGGPSVTADGIDAAGTKVTNVAGGTEPGDAVNYRQLQEVGARVDSQGDALRDLARQDARLERKIRRVGSHAAALAALHPQGYDEEHKFSAAVGFGQYHGSSAAAVGAFFRPTENLMLSVGASLKEHDSMVNAGLSYRFGGPSAPKPAAGTVHDLRQQVTVLTEENRSLSAKLTSSESRLASADAKLASSAAEIEALKARLLVIEKALKLK